jgi:hypothetical protein
MRRTEGGHRDGDEEYEGVHPTTVRSSSIHLHGDGEERGRETNGTPVAGEDAAAGVTLREE